MPNPRTPAGLSKRAQTFWGRMVDRYEFRLDELRLLEDACREQDLVDRLEREIKSGPLMVSGSMGQEVANPLIGEVRQHRTVLARLFAQLKLPDDDEEVGAGAPESASSKARRAAEARWRGSA